MKEKKRSIEVKGYNLEKYLFALHRITGIYMIAFLFFHILVTGQRIDLSIWDRTAISLTNNFVLLPFVLAVVFHGLNGIRLIISELGFLIGKPRLQIYPYKAASLGRSQRILTFTLMTVGVVLSALVVIEFLSRL
ncbi:MAG: hypothetical protein GTO54_12315 [Nitrososphaeria archaeon]|nr:hypothetical protein [Nitrososphaeria archaeon]